MSLTLLVGILAGCASAPQPRRLRRFEATLAAHESATAALQEWCRREGIGDPARIIARKVEALMLTGAADDPVPAHFSVLGVEPGQAIGYRHVRLECDSTVLSEAHNWFVPDRITPAMKAALDNTETPFGTVVRPLGFHRETLETVHGPAASCPADTILTHRALLRLPDGRPLALLQECYTRANMGR